MLENVSHATSFSRLGRRRGGFVDGVWVVWGAENLNMRSWIIVAMVYLMEWAFL